MRLAWIWYGGALVVSIGLVVIGEVKDGAVGGCIESIGSGMLASAIVAAYFELKQCCERRAQLKLRRQDYFEGLREEVRMVLARILWFSERKDDPNFNWQMRPEEYWRRAFFIPASSKYGRTSWNFEDGVSKLEAISKKLSAYEKMDPLEYGQYVALFRIVAAGSTQLCALTKRLQDDRDRAVDSGICSSSEVKDLTFSISLACQLMFGRDDGMTNYGLVISMLVKALNTLDADEAPLRKQFSMTWPWVFE